LRGFTRGFTGSFTRVAGAGAGARAGAGAGAGSRSSGAGARTGEDPPVLFTRTTLTTLTTVYVDLVGSRLLVSLHHFNEVLDSALFRGSHKVSRGFRGVDGEVVFVGVSSLTTLVSTLSTLGWLVSSLGGLGRLVSTLLVITTLLGSRLGGLSLVGFVLGILLVSLLVSLLGNEEFDVGFNVVFTRVTLVATLSTLVSSLSTLVSSLVSRLGGVGLVGFVLGFVLLFSLLGDEEVNISIGVVFTRVTIVATLSSLTSLTSVGRVGLVGFVLLFFVVLGNEESEVSDVVFTGVTTMGGTTVSSVAVFGLVFLFMMLGIVSMDGQEAGDEQNSDDCSELTR